MSEEVETPGADAHQQQLIDTGKLFDALAKDPKYRPRVLALIKEVNPNVPIPELDLAASLDDRVDSKTKAIIESNESLKKELGELRSTIQREKFAASNGLTDEELVEVEALAKDSGITKGETAVEHWRMRNQLGTPRPTRQAKESDEYVAKLRKVKPSDTTRLKALAIEEGTRILRESRGRRAG